LNEFFRKMFELYFYMIAKLSGHWSPKNILDMGIRQ